jgi:hypothetical protein
MITYAEDCKTLEPIEAWQRDWALFFIFGMTELEIDAEDVEFWNLHIDWVAARSSSPDDWLGEQGSRYRQACGEWRDPGAEFVQRWRRFADAHLTDSLDEIDRQLGVLLFDA